MRTPHQRLTEKKDGEFNIEIILLRTKCIVINFFSKRIRI